MLEARRADAKEGANVGGENFGDDSDSRLLVASVAAGEAGAKSSRQNTNQLKGRSPGGDEAGDGATGEEAKGLLATCLILGCGLGCPAPSAPPASAACRLLGSAEWVPCFDVRWADGKLLGGWKAGEALVESRPCHC